MLAEEASSISAAWLSDNPEGNLFTDNLKQSEVLPMRDRVHKNLQAPKGSTPTTIPVFTIPFFSLDIPEMMTTTHPPTSASSQVHCWEFECWIGHEREVLMEE